MDDFINTKTLGRFMEVPVGSSLTPKVPAATKVAAEQWRVYQQRMDRERMDQQMQDPWKHRSDGMKCRTCMWFAAKAPTPGVATGPDPRGAIGRCRRHAPTMNGYPVVFTSDWCGDHKLDETKA